MDTRLINYSRSARSYITALRNAVGYVRRGASVDVQKAHLKEQQRLETLVKIARGDVNAMIAKQDEQLEEAHAAEREQLAIAHAADREVLESAHRAQTERPESALKAEREYVEKVHTAAREHLESALREERAQSAAAHRFLLEQTEGLTALLRKEDRAKHEHLGSEVSQLESTIHNMHVEMEREREGWRAEKAAMEQRVRVLEAEVKEKDEKKREMQETRSGKTSFWTRLCAQRREKVIKDSERMNEEK